MHIFDFLFSNIAIVIAVIWFVFSLLGQKQKAEREQKKNPRPVAQPIEVEFPWEKVEQERADLERREPQPASAERNEFKPLQHGLEQTSFHKYQQVLERTQESLSSAQEMSRKEKGKSSKEPLFTPIDANRSQQMPGFHQLNRQQVVQGMVWSQVFGLPRAKDPHRTYSYLKSKPRP